MSRECSDNVGGYRVWYLDPNGEVELLTRGATMPGDTFVLAVPYDGPDDVPTPDQVRSSSPAGSVRFTVTGGDLVSLATGGPAPRSSDYPAVPVTLLRTQLQLRNVQGGPAALVLERSRRFAEVVGSHDWSAAVAPQLSEDPDGIPDGLVRHSLKFGGRSHWWDDDDDRTTQMWQEFRDAGLEDLEDVFETKAWFRYDPSAGAPGEPVPPGVAAGDTLMLAYQARLASRLGLSMDVWDDPVVAREMALFKSPYVDAPTPAAGAPAPGDRSVPDVTLDHGGTVMLLTSRHTYYNDEGYTTTPESTFGAALGADEASRYLLAKELREQLQGEMFPDDGSTAYRAVEVELPPGTVLDAGCVYAVWEPQAVWPHWGGGPGQLERRLVGVYPSEAEATEAAAALGEPLVFADVSEDVAGRDWADPDYGMPGLVARIEPDVEPVVTRDRYGYEVTLMPLWAAVTAIPVALPSSDSGDASQSTGQSAGQTSDQPSTQPSAQAAV